VSQENVEVVRAYLNAFAGGDVDASAAFWDPEITWQVIDGVIGEIRGEQAARRYAAEWLEMVADMTLLPEELLDAGAEQVVATLRVTGRWMRSGVVAQVRFAALYTLREGRIVAIREYSDRGEAVEAAGLTG
jgi:ketosteroid isomerase-like protein